MAAATISMAIATTRLAALASLTATNFTRNGALSRPAASCSRSCVFNGVSLARGNSTNAALVARAAEVGNGEVATEEVVTEEVATEEVATEEVVTEEVAAPARDFAKQGSTLYVGNLPWTCDSEQLAGILMEVGDVEAVEVLYEQDTGRSRGFAFVTMASNGDARAVVEALDGKDMGGRVLRVSFPKPSKNNPRVFNPGRTRPGNVNKMFVGNLSWACEQQDLVELFSGHGQVVEAKVVYDRDTGRSRGFGFVTMDSAAEVDTAISSLNGTDFFGRLLRVDKVEDKSSPSRE